MSHTEIINDFLIFVIEEYKDWENKTSIEVVDMFAKYDVFSFLIKNYDALHTMGGRAIADQINEFLK